MPNPLDKVLEYALDQVGDPYRWGAEGPDGFDCSGLVYAAFKAAGFDVQRTTASVIGRGGGGYGHVSRSADLARAQAGDVLYYDNPGATDHVAIYLGNGQMVEAPTEGVPVRVTKARQPTKVVQPDGASGSSWIPDWLPGLLPGGGVYNLPTGDGDQTLGDVARDDVAEKLAALNPFGLWQEDVLRIGLLVLGGVAASALVIVGAKEALGAKAGVPSYMPGAD